MRKLNVYIEINGKMVNVGLIEGNGTEDSAFSYLDEYVESKYARPISIQLPLQKEPFSVKKTKIFFEGLLPEGFTRKSVARHLHIDENDYLSILSKLGSECLGAIMIKEDDAIVGPEYEKISSETIKRLAEEGITEAADMVAKSHLSLTGASGKVGLYRYDNKWYLPKGIAPSSHIVKLSHVRLDNLVLNEQLCLLTAKKLGIIVPESEIINTGNGIDGDVLFATKRYDRSFENITKLVDEKPCPFRLHQEDFAQGLGIEAEKKYETNESDYMKKMFELLRQKSSDSISDQLKLWDIIVFDYLIGNTDSHVKNFSLLYNKDLTYVNLAPAYDIVSTVIYKSSTRDMAFNIGGEYNIDVITRENFVNAAKDAELGRIAIKHFDDMASKWKDKLIESAYELEEQGFINARNIADRIIVERNNI